VHRTALKPTFQGQTCEVNHLVTQVCPTNTLESESHKTPGLTKTFQEAFAQTYNLKQGIKKFGEKGILQGAVTEMKQLHDRSCFKPLDVSKLTDKRRRQAMNSLFLSQKKEMVESKGELWQVEVSRDSG